MNKGILLLGIGGVALLGLSMLHAQKEPELQGATNMGGYSGALVTTTEGAPSSPSTSYTYNIKVEAPKIDFGKTNDTTSSSNGTKKEDNTVTYITSSGSRWHYSKKEGVLTSPTGEGYSTAYPEQTIRSIESSQTKKETKTEPSPTEIWQHRVTEPSQFYNPFTNSWW